MQPIEWMVLNFAGCVVRRGLQTQAFTFHVFHTRHDVISSVLLFAVFKARESGPLVSLLT